MKSPHRESEPYKKVNIHTLAHPFCDIARCLNDRAMLFNTSVADKPPFITAVVISPYFFYVLRPFRISHRI